MKLKYLNYIFYNHYQMGVIPEIGQFINFDQTSCENSDLLRREYGLAWIVLRSFAQLRMTNAPGHPERSEGWRTKNTPSSWAERRIIPNTPSGKQETARFTHFFNPEESYKLSEFRRKPDSLFKECKFSNFDSCEKYRLAEFSKNQNMLSHKCYQ